MAIFGHFSSWIVEDSKVRQLPYILPYIDLRNEERFGGGLSRNDVADVARLLAAKEHFAIRVVNSDEKPYHNRDISIKIAKGAPTRRRKRSRSFSSASEGRNHHAGTRRRCRNRLLNRTARTQESARLRHRLCSGQACKPVR